MTTLRVGDRVVFVGGDRVSWGMGEPVGATGAVVEVGRVGFAAVRVVFDAKPQNRGWIFAEYFDRLPEPL